MVFCCCSLKAYSANFILSLRYDYLPFKYFLLCPNSFIISYHLLSFRILLYFFHMKTLNSILIIFLLLVFCKLVCKPTTIITSWCAELSYSYFHFIASNISSKGHPFVLLYSLVHFSISFLLQAIINHSMY